MKVTIAFILVILGAGTVSAYDDIEIKGQAEIEGFTLGRDKDLGGNFSYIVDRTSMNCFAVVSDHQSNIARSGGITRVPCKSLSKIKAIDEFIKSGKKPD